MATFRTPGTHYHKLFIVNELYEELVPIVVIFAMAFNILFSNCIFYLFIRFYLFAFRESSREGESEGEKHECVRDTVIGCLSHAPYWGSGPQPRHVP